MRKMILAAAVAGVAWAVKRAWRARQLGTVRKAHRTSIPRIYTQEDWITELANSSEVIRALAPGVPARGDLAPDAFNIANDAEHEFLIARAIEELASQSALKDAQLQDILLNLASRNTYGAFAELAGYEWLLRNGAHFQAQVGLSAAESLNPNGVAIDGAFRLREGYFDIKAFGFSQRPIDSFVEQLGRELTGLRVRLEGSTDVPAQQLTTLFRTTRQIAQALRRDGTYEVPRFGWRLRAAPPQPVDMAVTTTDPYALAQQNRHFVFKTASQFARAAPFLLIFVIHPWTNKALATNFAGFTDHLTRALARRTFLEFKDDASPVALYDDKADPSATLAHAARSLSGILFMNVWSAESPAWLYSNPLATHPIRREHLERLFDFEPLDNMAYDDFAHDCY